MKLVLSCEHAFNSIPEPYTYLFKGDPQILQSHLGYDPGAYDLFQTLAGVSDYSNYHTTGRLLIEVNRSLGNKQLFSDFTKSLDVMEKLELVQKYYQIYRDEIESSVYGFINEGENVFHLSVHTFTPELNGEARNCDIGLLYDPQRKEEKELCRRYRKEILKDSPHLKIRMNYPYLGKSDGFTTYLRKRFKKSYAGVELEVNQKWVENNRMQKELKCTLYESLRFLI